MSDQVREAAELAWQKLASARVAHARAVPVLMEEAFEILSAALGKDREASQ